MNISEYAQRLIELTGRNLRVSSPAKIISYDANKQMAQIQLVLPFVTLSGERLEQPVINDVPVLFHRSGGALLTFPVVVGDCGLAIFSDEDLGAWLSESRTELDSTRNHSINDAVFIPGLGGGGFVAEKDNVVLKYNDTTIKITKAGIVEITGDVDITGDVSIDGDLSTTGKITADGDITAGGDVVAGSVSLQNHTHTDSIGGTTSPPN